MTDHADIDHTGITGAGSPTEILDIPTAEMDDTLVLAPDGAGGVEFRAESTGGSLNIALYKRTAGNYSTTSTSYVDVDATNLALALTTGANRVEIGLVGSVEHSLSGGIIYLDVDLDGARLGGTDGLVIIREPSAQYRQNASFTWITAAVTAGAHTFKLQWKASAATATLFGASGGQVMQFWVKEL